MHVSAFHPDLRRDFLHPSIFPFLLSRLKEPLDAYLSVPVFIQQIPFQVFPFLVSFIFLATLRGKQFIWLHIGMKRDRKKDWYLHDMKWRRERERMEDRDHRIEEGKESEAIQGEKKWQFVIDPC